jgi:hypothetical protein
LWFVHYRQVIFSLPFFDSSCTMPLAGALIRRQDDRVGPPYGDVSETTVSLSMGRIR